MSMKILKMAVLALGAGVAWPAAADVTIGVTVSSTGSGAALGIPMRNSVQLWPAEIAGEKLNVVLLDDADLAGLHALVEHQVARRGRGRAGDHGHDGEVLVGDGGERRLVRIEVERAAHRRGDCLILGAAERRYGQ